MGTLLGGSRWDDKPTPLDDDWYYYKTEEARKNNPLDDDYVLEKHRTNKEGYSIFAECVVDKDD